MFSSPEVLFKTCVAIKFVDDDDDDKSRTLAPSVWQPTALNLFVPVLRDRCLSVYIIMIIVCWFVLTEIKTNIIIIIILYSHDIP